MSLQWLISLLEDLQRQGPATQIGFWLAVLSAIGVLYGWGRSRWQRGLERERRKIDRLEREIASLRVRNDELEAVQREQRARIEGMEARLPDYQRARAERDLADRNVEHAIGCLRRAVEDNAADLAACCIELSRFHFALFDKDEAKNSTGLLDASLNAERYANLAWWLAPGDPQVDALRREAATLLAAVLGHEAASRRDYTRALEQWDEAYSFAFGNDERAQVEAVPALIAAAANAIGKGTYYRALALARRAETNAERALGMRDAATLLARYYVAVALNFLGEHRRALEEVEALLLLRKEVDGPRHPHTLATRHLLAWVLQGLGEHRRAQEAIEALLPLTEEVKGPHHPDTLSTRHLLARVLDNLGEHRRAREEIEALLPLREEILGPHHPDTLSRAISSRPCATVPCSDRKRLRNENRWAKREAENAAPAASAMDVVGNVIR